MAYDFHVGMRVVCVKDPNWETPPPAGVECPVRGTIYTIREIPTAPEPHEKAGQLFLRLQEILNPTFVTPFGSFEPAFYAKNFRPVDETKLNIFRKLLVPATQRESELA